MYALGGGFGHAVRGAALAAAFQRRGGTARVLVPASHVELAQALGADAEGVEPTRDPRALRRCVDAAIERSACSLLVVDSFPAGLLGELAPLPQVARRALLLRLGRDLALHAAADYDVVVDLEPHLDWLPPGFDATPFGPVARLPDGPGTAPSGALLVASDVLLAPLLVRVARRVARTGRRVELALSGQLGSPGAAPTAVFPVPLATDAPRVVVGAAGYNLVYEACAARAAHLAVPLPRRFDNQYQRARALCEVPASPEALEARVIELLDGAPARPREVQVKSHDELASQLRGDAGPARNLTARTRWAGA